MKNRWKKEDEIDEEGLEENNRKGRRGEGRQSPSELLRMASSLLWLWIAANLYMCLCVCVCVRRASVTSAQLIHNFAPSFFPPNEALTTYSIRDAGRHHLFYSPSSSTWQEMQFAAPRLS